MIRRQSFNPSANFPAELGGTVVLRLDFVAKPAANEGLHRRLATLLEQTRLQREGLESGVLLVSDREARLVTLLTFWDCARFNHARERRIAWMQKLLTPFADGIVRAHTSQPRFLLHDEPCAPEAHNLQPIPELHPIAG